MKKLNPWNMHFAKLVIGSSLMLGMSMAYAADDLHAGDIEIEVETGKVHVHGAAEIQAGTGYAIFEGDFGDAVKGPYGTRNPGFDSHEGTFAAGALVYYKAIGNLWYWNGATWSNTVSNGEKILLEGNLGEESTFTTGGISGDTTGLVGEADGSGVVHEHVDYKITSSSGLPTAGAYFITLSLTSASYSESDPFIIVFNNGLEDADFEASVAALTAIPEPESYALMLAGLAFIGMRRRQKL